jgi:TRAP-type C4-dicarboxylate transport system permease small subunit
MYDKLINFRNSKVWKITDNVQSAILFFCSVSITITIFMTVIMRYVFKTDLYGVEELILVIAFWLYFIGGSRGSMEDSHIKADILDVVIQNDKLKYGLKSFGKAVESFVLIVFAKMSLDLVILNFQRMPKTPGLKIPYVVTQTSIALGFFMMAL